MKMTRRLTAFSLAALLGSLTLTGCSNRVRCDFNSSLPSLDSPVQVVSIEAPAANFVDFESIVSAADPSVTADLGGKLPAESLPDAIGREFSVVLADGVPQLVVKKVVDPAGDSEADIRREVTSSVTTFNLVARCAAGEYKVPGDEVVTEPETDYLAAMSIASDQFTNPTADHKLYILGNGIQTAGAIRMQNKGLFPKSENLAAKLVAALDSRGEIPDLSGVEVHWYGLGQVDGQKQRLSESARDSLIAFWSGVISAAGGSLAQTNIYGQVGTGQPHPNSIETTSVDVRTCKLLTFYEDDGLGFKPDSDSFLEPAKARSVAQSVADQFNAGECDSMTISGFAAAGVDQKKYSRSKQKIDSVNSKLTLLRAKAFKQLVKASGFAGEISIVGKGTCGTEWRADGTADPKQQQLCRRVEVAN